MHSIIKRVFCVIIFMLVCLPNLGQNNDAEYVLPKLNELITAHDFEQAESVLNKNENILDSVTYAIFASIIDIGKDAQNISTDQNRTIEYIKFVIGEFAQNKEELKNAPIGMMAYFNIYISYLSKKSNPFYFEVYKLFKEIWPEYREDSAQIYIYTLENTSLQLYTELKYSEAIPILEELIKLGEAGSKLSSEPYVNYMMLGRCHQNLGNDELASILFDKAIIRFSANNKKQNEESYNNLLRDRFEIAAKLSQIDKARDLGKKLIDFYHNKEGHIHDLANVFFRLGETELSALNMSSGMQYYEQGVDIVLHSNDYNDNTKKQFLESLYTIYNKCNITENDRKYKDYKVKYNISGEQISDWEIVDEQYISTLQNIVNSQESQLTDTRNYIRAIQGLAEHVSSRQQEFYGLQIIEKAIKWLKQNNIDEQEYARLYSSMGSIYASLQDTDNAIDWHKKAQHIYTINGIYNADYINILCDLSTAYRLSGDIARAKAYLDEASERSTSMTNFSSDKTIYFKYLNSMSDLYSALGDEDQALSYNKTILDSMPVDENFNLVRKTFLLNRIQILLNFNRYEEARAITNELGPDFINESRCWWMIFNTKYFNNDITCENELEQIKNSDLKDLQRLYTSFPHEHLYNYWDVIGGNLNFAYSMALSKFNTPTLRCRTYDNLLFTKGFQLELSKYLRLHPDDQLSTELFDKIVNTLSNTTKIQNIMGKNDVAIEFFVVSKRPTFHEVEKAYGALILQKDMSSPVYIELCPCDSIDQIAYASTIGQAEEYADRYYNITNTKLYKLIWEPLKDVIPENSEVYISGCNGLLFINFPAISNGEKRLNDLYRIHNTISTSYISHSQQNASNYHSASLFGGIDYNTPLSTMAEEAKKYSHDEHHEHYTKYRGVGERGDWDNLKYSEEEVLRIKQLLSRRNLKVNTYTSISASEEAFKALSGNSPDILHLSTHGYYYQPYLHDFRSEYSSNDSDNLKRNGLLFSGANNAWRNNEYKENVDDGILTAQEISALNFSKTSLVTLSACQTGLGETNDIDGNEGLLRAFKIAGVKDVLVSLWNISDDATSLFMEKFYKHLLSSNNPWQALNLTVKDIQTEMPDPYYWAPFVIVE